MSRFAPIYRHAKAKRYRKKNTTAAEGNSSAAVALYIGIS